MKTISARELRNEYARVLRELQDAGETYTITSNGRAVARIVPVAPVPDRLRGFSGVPLAEVVGLNAAAGPFDHAELDRQAAEVLDPVARDPYADRPATTAPRRVLGLAGPSWAEVAEQIADERSARP